MEYCDSLIVYMYPNCNYYPTNVFRGSIAGLLHVQNNFLSTLHQ